MDKPALAVVQDTNSAAAVRKWIVQRQSNIWRARGLLAITHAAVRAGALPDEVDLDSVLGLACEELERIHDDMDPDCLPIGAT